MKIYGIICEYNPMHNGHVKHLAACRGSGAGVVAVMSGNFVQRGDAAILDKFTRARLAVEAGVNLVMELPVSYALAPADNFAMGAVGLLDALGCVEEVVFGSECGEMKVLYQAAEAVARCKSDYAEVLEDLMKSGCSYPDALSALVLEVYGPKVEAVLKSPNNTLAIAYLRAMQMRQSPMKARTVLREGAGHHGSFPVRAGGDEMTASATHIRRVFAEGGDCRRLVPANVWRALKDAAREGRISSQEYLERLILARLRTVSIEELEATAEVGQGLEYRIYQARSASSLEELLMHVKTKRYPMARLRRVMLHMLLGITHEDMQGVPPYARVLAWDETGQRILHEAKKTRRIPVDTSLAALRETSEAAARCAMLEARATDLYNLTTATIGKGEMDYRVKLKPVK